MKEEKTFELNIFVSDIISGHEPTDSPLISITIDNKSASIITKGAKLGTKKLKNIILLEKKEYETVLKEAKKIATKYGREFRGSRFAENVPLDEYKDTTLMKFVLKKLKI